MVSPAGLAGDVAQLSTAFCGVPREGLGAHVQPVEGLDGAVRRRLVSQKQLHAEKLIGRGRVRRARARARAAPPESLRRCVSSREGPNAIDEGALDAFCLFAFVSHATWEGAGARAGSASVAPGAGRASFRNASSLLRSICSRIASSTTGALCVCRPAEPFTAGALGAPRESGFTPNLAVGAGGLGAGWPMLSLGCAARSSFSRNPSPTRFSAPPFHFPRSGARTRCRSTLVGRAFAAGASCFLDAFSHAWERRWLPLFHEWSNISLRRNRIDARRRALSVSRGRDARSRRGARRRRHSRGCRRRTLGRAARPRATCSGEARVVARTRLHPF